MVFEDKSLVFDERVFSVIHPYTNTGATRLALAITFFGSSAFLLPAYIILIAFLLFIKKLKYDALKLLSIAVTGTVVLILLKSLLQRARPLLPVISKEHGYSFPSGHTFSSVVFYGILVYIAGKNIKNGFIKWPVVIALVVFTMAIGFTRIYLRYHYASDVIAGFCLGIMWLLLAKWIFRLN